MELAEQYFLESIKWDSLTQAAGALGISQPALSLALTNLEKKLGVTLLDRKRKPLRFTEEGSIYAEYLHKQRELELQLQKELSDAGEQRRRVLSIGAATVYIESLVADVIPQLLESYPNCQIDMHIGPLEKLVQNAVDGEIECFICTDEKNIPDNFRLVQIRSEHLYLCVPAHFPVNERLRDYQVKLGEQREVPDYRAFDGCELIKLPSRYPLQRRMDAFFEKKGMHVSSFLCVNQVATGVALAQRGLGMVVASQEAIMGRNLKEEVCLYSLPQEVSGRKIYLAYDSDHYISKICKVFIDLMKGKEENENIKEN